MPGGTPPRTPPGVYSPNGSIQNTYIATHRPYTVHTAHIQPYTGIHIPHIAHTAAEQASLWYPSRARARVVREEEEETRPRAGANGARGVREPHTKTSGRGRARLRVVVSVLFVRVARCTPVRGTSSRYRCIVRAGWSLRRISQRTKFRAREPRVASVRQHAIVFFLLHRIVRDARARADSLTELAAYASRTRRPRVAVACACAWSCVCCSCASRGAPLCVARAADIVASLGAPRLPGL
jgi:hypothetical protein